MILFIVCYLGFVVGSVCVIILDVVNYVLLFIVFVFFFVVFGLVIYIKR